MSQNGAPPRGIYCPYQIVNILPEKPIKFVCQSREWENVDTHWYMRHSILCEGTPTCPICVKGNSKVWKAYLFGQSQSGGVSQIFQLTPLAAYQLENATRREDGLLGAIIKLTRAGRRKNSPLEADIRGYCEGVLEVSAQILERTVAVLYRQYDRVQLDSENG